MNIYFIPFITFSLIIWYKMYFILLSYRNLFPFILFSCVEQSKQYKFILNSSKCFWKRWKHDISFSFAFRMYTLHSYVLLHQKAHIENYFYQNLCYKNKLYSLYQCKQGLSGNSMNRRNNSIGNLYTASSCFQRKYQCTHYEEGERL